MIAFFFGGSTSYPTATIEQSLNNATWLAIARSSAGDNESGGLSAVIPANVYYRFSLSSGSALAIVELR